MKVYRPAIRWWSPLDMRLGAHYTESLEVLDDRVILRRGLLDKTETVIPFSKITNFSTYERAIDRLFGLADFRVETAGTIAPELELKGYPAEHLRQVLSRALDVTS